MLHVSGIDGKVILTILVTVGQFNLQQCIIFCKIIMFAAWLFCENHVPQKNY